MGGGMRLRRSLDAGLRVFNVRLCGVKSPGVDDPLYGLLEYILCEIEWAVLYSRIAFWKLFKVIFAPLAAMPIQKNTTSRSF
jgi:hypothetical protein